LVNISYSLNSLSNIYYNYKPIKKELDRMENAEIIGYAEPTISDKHRTEGYN